MNIIDRAKSHFESQGLTRIEVPEWPDENGNATVLFSQPFTLQERKTLQKYAKEDDLEFVIRLVIMKAMNEAGEKVFDISDKPVFLNRVDPNVITRIAEEMMMSPSTQEMAGN